MTRVTDRAAARRPRRRPLRRHRPRTATATARAEARAGSAPADKSFSDNDLGVRRRPRRSGRRPERGRSGARTFLETGEVPAPAPHLHLLRSRRDGRPGPWARGKSPAVTSEQGGSMHTRRLLTTLAAVGILGAFAAGAEAGTITFTGIQVQENGTGFGSVLNLLSVQASGSGTSEYGEITWNGVSDVENVGDTKNSSETRSVADIFGATGNNDVGLIFNINQQGSDTSLFLHNFDLLVF